MIQLPPTLRLATIQCDCSRCAECGKDNTKLDGSIRNGGKHLLENLLTLCSKCHRTLESSRLKRPHTNTNQAISMTVTVTLLLVLGAASSPAALAFDFGVDPNPITFHNPYTNSSIVKSTIVCQTGTYDLNHIINKPSSISIHPLIIT
jgi:hypothetical protein